MNRSILEMRGIRKSYGELEVLKGIDLTVHSGEVVGLIGASGSGKSTLLRCINRLEEPNDGTVFLQNERVGAPGPGAARRLCNQRRRMAMVFQNFNLWPHRTALENVIEGLIVVQKRPRDQAIARGMDVLRKVGLAERAGHYPSQLSGGQQQRVAIARALAPEPDLILFDEPTSALDPELVGEVLRVMTDLAAEGMTMIVVTHEMAFARDVCTKVLYLEKGLVRDQGTPEHIFSPENSATRQFLGRFHGNSAEGGAQ